MSGMRGRRSAVDARAAGHGGWAAGLDRLIRSSRPATSSGSWRTDRAWQAGFLVGSALGAAATVLTRRAERSARRGLVDWIAAEAVAVTRLRRAPGSLPATELRSTEAFYADAMSRIVPALGTALETDLPGVVERSGVVDRAGWVHANISTFQQLMAHLETELIEQVVPRGGGLAKASLAIANRFVTTRQIGFLLGFLGQRVLGQYDIALLSAEAAPGRLLFVEENIRQTARSLDVPLNEFRTWIALHETTHAFEFESHPWLRPYLAERMEKQIAALSSEVTLVGREGMHRLRMMFDQRDGEHWMERMMGPEQRQAFRETQAVMSLLEGFSDYIMDEVGQDLVPGVAQISERFHRRRERRGTVERAIMRLTGMDLKMDQYRKGEQFVSAVAKLGGPAALRRLWDSPETLPRHGEIDHPARWIERVIGTAGSPAAGSDGAA